MASHMDAVTKVSESIQSNHSWVSTVSDKPTVRSHCDLNSSQLVLALIASNPAWMNGWGDFHQIIWGLVQCVPTLVHANCYMMCTGHSHVDCTAEWLNTGNT